MEKGSRVLVWTPTGWRRPGTILRVRKDVLTSGQVAKVLHDNNTIGWHLVATLKVED